jgi:hypothetical protein
MARNIIGVITGYIAMAAFIIISFSILYLILGSEGAFQPGSYKVTITWLILSFALSFTAAILGGYICTLIAKNIKAALWLAGIVIIIGAISAVPHLNVSEEEMNKLREGEVSNFEAMQNAKQPPLAFILTPLVGAFGVSLGSRMKKE